MAASTSRTTPNTALIRVLLAIGFPLIAAATVAGTYLNKELIVTAGWVASGTIAFLVVTPVAGLAVMTTAYMLAAYPTVLQSLGVFTINNLLGVAFVGLLALRLIETRDFSFLKAPPVVLLIIIGVIFGISSWHSTDLFPLLQQSRGKVLMLDRSDEMWHDFLTRLAYLVFIIVFVRTKADIKLMWTVFFMSLFVAVPSALYNLLTGQLNRGFRIMSSVTGGTNPNRLAMICLLEVACWWCWAHTRPTVLRFVIAFGAIGASVIVLLGTGSRSGLLGIAVLGGTLQFMSHQRYRLAAWQIGALSVLGVIVIATIIPPEAFSRMINFDPEHGQIGASSNTLREGAVLTGLHIAWDHPVMGIGLGNFREVSRQIYLDENYRPPHNSFLWAMCEGGIVVIAAYMYLFWLMWSDLQSVKQRAPLDLEIAHIETAMRMVFILLMFFSVFADLWLLPQTYIMAGLIFVTRRYLDGLEQQVRATRAPVVVRPRFAIA